MDTYVVVTQKKSLNETALLSNQNICLDKCIQKQPQFDIDMRERNSSSTSVICW